MGFFEIFLSHLLLQAASLLSTTSAKNNRFSIELCQWFSMSSKVNHHGGIETLVNYRKQSIRYHYHYLLR